MRYFIDANIFLRILVADEKKQYEECVRLIKTVKENKIEKVYTNTVVLAEVTWTLSSYYKFSKSQVIKSIRSILNLSGLDIVDGYKHMRAIDLYERFSVKYIDALIASDENIMSKDTIIISYDADFDKLDVLRKEPKEIM